ADGRPDEIGPVGIEPFLHHQIDLTEVDIAEVNRDLLGVGGLGPQLADVVRHNGRHPFFHPLGWFMDARWMLAGDFQEPSQRPSSLESLRPGASARIAMSGDDLECRAANAAMNAIAITSGEGREQSAFIRRQFAGYAATEILRTRCIRTCFETPSERRISEVTYHVALPFIP